MDQAGPLAGAHVLIADDNAVNLQVASFHVEDLGCSFATAVDGSAALALARVQAFEFVLMDCQMPVMDGFQALREIRAHQSGSRSPQSIIVAVTADDDADHRAACESAGFDDFLAKPFSAAQLQAVLTRCRMRAHAPQGDLTSAAASASRHKQDAASAPVLDLVILAAFVADFGLDTAPSLLASFVKSLRESAAKFVDAQAAHDTPALQALAHKIAGASGTVGARQLNDLARQLQTACKRQEFKWSNDIAMFEQSIATTLAAFEPLTNPNSLEQTLKFSIAA